MNFDREAVIQAMTRVPSDGTLTIEEEAYCMALVIVALETAFAPEEAPDDPFVEPLGRDA